MGAAYRLPSAGGYQNAGKHADSCVLQRGEKVFPHCRSQRCRESGEAPPAADKASRFRGSTPVSRCEAAGNRLVRRCIPSWVSRTHPLPARACSIRKAAQPLTAALPYRFRKFSVLSTVSDLWPLTGGLSAVNKSGFDALTPFMTRQSMLSLIPPERSEGWTTTVTGSLPLHSKV